MQDADDLTDHISSYERKHTYTTERCQGANDQSPYRHLLEYLKSDGTTARHRLMSLPTSMDNIVDNLPYKDPLTSVDVRSRLLELSGSSNLSSNGKALNARSHKVNQFNNKKKTSEKPNPTRPGKTEPHKGNPCSYCKKHNHAYEGHTHKFCNWLKSTRHNTASSSPPAAPIWEIVPYCADLTVNEEDDHDVALITSSLPHPVATIPSCSAFKTVNDTTYKVWIFYTRASFHITADFTHLLEPRGWHVGLTMGGVACLHARPMGSVQLHIEIGGRVLSLTLSDDLYVPDWDEACLCSCWKIDMLGCFRMGGEDGIITVPRE